MDSEGQQGAVCTADVYLVNVKIFLHDFCLVFMMFFMFLQEIFLRGSCTVNARDHKHR